MLQNIVAKKATAYTIMTPAYDGEWSSEYENTISGSIKCEISKDKGEFVDCTNTWVELEDTGVGYLDLTATEMNANNIVVKISTTDIGVNFPIFYINTTGTASSGYTPVDTTGVQDLINKFRRMSAMTLQSDDSDSDYIQFQALTDDEIYDCLENAVDDFNLFPPLLTDFTLETLLDTNSSYAKLLILGAQIYAIIMLEFYEIGMYFQVSDDGHSITRNKFGHYSSMKNQLWGLYEKMITMRKQQYSMNATGIRGLFSTVATSPWQAYKGTRATRYSLYSSTRRTLR